MNDARLVELLRVVTKIALAEHADGCKMSFAPIDACTCYRPADWASEALGIKPPWNRSERQNKKLRRSLKGSS